MAITEADLRKIIRDEVGRPTWQFKNENLTNMDAYAILRGTHSRANALPSLQQIREAQSMHAGKVHAAVTRELEARVVPLLENLAGAVAAIDGGEAFDVEKFKAGVHASVTEALAGAEDALREAVAEAIAELPDRSAEEIAQAVVDNYVGRLTPEGD